MSHTRISTTILFTLSLLAVSASAGETKGFEPLNRPVTPGERVGAAAQFSAGIDSGVAARLAAAPTKRSPTERVPTEQAVQDGAASATLGYSVTEGSFYFYTSANSASASDDGRSARAIDYLGPKSSGEFMTFDRSTSTNSYYRPFSSYSPAWRDRSFANRLQDDVGYGLPSVSAPLEFYGFGR